MISKSEANKLMTSKKTDKLSGFISKAGKTFDASLALDPEFKTIFLFDGKNN